MKLYMLTHAFIQNVTYFENYCKSTVENVVFGEDIKMRRTFISESKQTLCLGGNTGNFFETTNHQVF